MMRPGPDPASEFDSAPSSPLRVLFLAAEAAPFIKVGGLGDVAGSLPQALLRLPPEVAGGKPLDVRLVIPFHGELRQRLPDLELVARFLVNRAGGAVQAEVYQTQLGSLKVYLIAGPPIPHDAPVYSLSAEEDGEKYVFFSLAAVELTRAIGWKPDIVHANDWHTAIAPYSICQNRDKDPYFQSIQSVMSVHNLPFMGGGSEKALVNYGIHPPHSRSLPRWAHTFPLPLGLWAADRIIAVSPSYAKEILTPEFGCGLQDFLLSRSERVTGILNGLDVTSWDPSTDSVIVRKFDREHLDLRAENKTALQEEAGLPVVPDIPLMIMIGRMDPQKGVDLAIDTLRQSAGIPWQLIVLGTGVPFIESAARSLEVEFPDRARAMIRFDGNLARRMYAGGDLILMPSRYEPCGLAQMIAMRYGCVPLARATGGLKDTITDAAISERRTGFLFEEASMEDFSGTFLRAVEAFHDQPSWRKIQEEGMEQDFSWDRSAEAYVRVYRQLTKG